MNYDRVSATISTRAVDPRTGDDNPILKQRVRFRSNLQEQLFVMDVKLDSLLDMATSIQLLISKMNKERGLVENVVAAYPQITTRFGEKNQLPVPSSIPIATTVSDSVTSSNSIELMNKDTIQPEEKFEAKSETQQKSEIESGASPIVPEGAGRIVTVLSKETGNSDFELESSKNNVDKFGFGSELSKNNNVQEVFDGLTNWNLKPPEEVAAFVDSKKDIYAHMKTDLYRVSVATSVEYFGKKCNEAMQVFDPGGSALDVRVLKFLRLLGEESGDVPSETADNETALVSAIEAMSSRLELSPTDYDSKKERQLNYEKACREKFATPEETQESELEERDKSQEINVATSKSEQAVRQSIIESDGRPMEEAAMVGYQKKITVLYELLSACLADTPADSKMSTKRRKGYDARHRVALRLLATWFDVKWIKMEAIETNVACTAMALLKEEESKEEGQSSESSWEKWKRGGIISAAALTGGTLIAITGGLAAPAIAAGFSVLAPTLGTIIPVIGASGFAAVASAAGNIAGSVAVAASFGAAGAGLTGSKVATRIGDVDEFEFKAIGDNHNQGRLAVEISVSGFVFEEEDFIRPWEAQHENLERYALQWESKHLGSDNLERIIDDCLVAKYFLELQFKMGNSRAVLHLYCLISLELKKLIPLKTLLWLDWLLSAFRSQIYPEVYRIFHSPDLANLMTLDFESLKGGSSSLISFSNMFIGCSGSFGETIISTSIEAKGQGVSLEFIISFGSRELNVGVGMMTESLIKQRGDHSTMSRVSKVDKMLDRPSAKPPFQFRYLSFGDKTLSRRGYCHEHNIVKKEYMLIV